jgi:hypothetical protein
MHNESPTFSSDGEAIDEAETYQHLSSIAASPQDKPRENLRTTPLLTLSVKDAVELQRKNLNDKAVSTTPQKQFPQYAVVGFNMAESPELRKHEAILMNVDAPNSTFICGTQGSGKSYTLSCMMENCLFADRRIGHIGTPVAGVAFHYDQDSTITAAEVAHLCSLGISVKVLVSQSNERVLRKAYSKLPRAEKYLTMSPLLLDPSDLNVQHMQSLMAFADRDTAMPLYMSVALRVLRHMAMEAGGESFNYNAFKAALGREDLTKEQSGPLKMRLELLESFLDSEKESSSMRSSRSQFDIESGTLTIVDLTDPFMDPATVCILFDICLSIFKRRRPLCGIVVALDEAHKYMTSSLAASNFTERLLGTVREQRHNATRVIIATQEPTISEKLLDLCTVSIVHHFTSPAWFTSIRNHIGGASGFALSPSEQDTMFTKILDLDVGESLVFAPSALLRLSPGGVIGKLGYKALEMKTRRRIGHDGGMSMLASRQADVCSEAGTDEEVCAYEADVAVHFDGIRLDNPHVATGQAAAHGTESMAVRIGVDSLTPSRSGSHLLLICCSCEQAVLIEFNEHFLPHLVEVDRSNVRAGIAYATCTGCVTPGIAGSKTALKRFDYERGNEFRKGTISVNGDHRQRLKLGLELVLGKGTTVLVRDGKIVYLFTRVVQRAIKDQDLLWMICLDRNAVSQPTVRLSAHQNGMFFESSY